MTIYQKILGIRLNTIDFGSVNMVFFCWFFLFAKNFIDCPMGTTHWVVTRAGNGTEPICITFQGEVILKIVYWAPKRKIPYGQVFHMGQVSPTSFTARKYIFRRKHSTVKTHFLTSNNCR
eukprot:sb/3476185/